MIFIKNRLIFGLITKIITTVFKFVYAILSAFCLQLTLLVALVGLIIYFVGGFEGGGAILTVFVIALVLSIFYAVFGTVKKLLGLGKKEKKTRVPPQIIEQRQEIEPTIKYAPTEQTQNYQPSAPPVSIEKPVYYRVKQNPNYLMAEYSDRYELYAMQNGQMVRLRTDYK